MSRLVKSDNFFVQDVQFSSPSPVGSCLHAEIGSWRRALALPLFQLAASLRTCTCWMLGIWSAFRHLPRSLWSCALRAFLAWWPSLRQWEWRRNSALMAIKSGRRVRFVAVWRTLWCYSVRSNSTYLKMLRLAKNFDLLVVLMGAVVDWMKYFLSDDPVFCSVCLDLVVLKLMLLTWGLVPISPNLRKEGSEYAV